MAFVPQSRSSERWELEVGSPAAGVLVSRARGHFDLEAVSHLMAGFDDVARTQKPVEAFHDWEGVSGYTTEARNRYTAWSKSHRDDVDRVHILVGSRMVALAISVANIAVGGFLRSYTDRGSFERARDSALARRARPAS